MTQKELAKNLDMTQPSVAAVIRELGWKTKRSHCPEERLEKIQTVLKYIEENGGTVANAIRKLDIALYHQAVHEYARETGFDLASYRIAYQRFGLWMVLPGVPKPMYTADFQVDAICLGCNTTHKILMTNARYGQSTGCVSCALKNKKRFKVKCTKTGTIYRSIRAFALAIDQHKRYQQLRIKLMKHGEIEVDGILYLLQEKEPTP